MFLLRSKKPNVNPPESNAMKHYQVILVGLLASIGIVPGVNAQSLLGERYFSLEGGWERIENDASDDGRGAGIELNAPIDEGFHRDAFGGAVNFSADYMNVLDRDFFNLKAVIREYLLPEAGRPFSPFLGLGFGWVDFEETVSTYLPLEAGVEFELGPVSLLPFFRYSVTFKDRVNNFWTAGAAAAYWLRGNWGIRASFAYTDYGNINGLDPLERGMRARGGLIFLY